MVDLATSMTESFPAVAASLPIARGAVSALADQGGASPEQLGDIRLAVSESLTNVILHAYGDEPGEIHLSAALIDGELWVLIADDGGGLRSRTDRSGLGLGLTLIAQASDEVTIVKRSTGGTELRMRFRLGGVDVDPVDQSLGSVLSATWPAASSFSTTA
jgi:anti-sigma regulatory factor (Ser/Thr protein kinase)